MTPKIFSSRLLIAAMTAGAILVAVSLFLNADHGPALRKAAYYGDIKKVQNILKKHPNVINSSREHPFFRNQFLSKARILFGMLLGSDFEKWDAVGYSALDLAVKGNHSEMVAFLLKNKANMRQLNHDNCAAIHLAVEHGRIEMVKIFLDHGVDLDLQDKTGTTPLGWAVLYNHTVMAEFLLENGADIHGGKIPPLHCAVESQSKAMAELLLANGAEINKIDNYQRTPLDVAILKRDNGMMTFLRERGATNATAAATKRAN